MYSLSTDIGVRMILVLFTLASVCELDYITDRCTHVCKITHPTQTPIGTHIENFTMKFKITYEKEST